MLRNASLRIAIKYDPPTDPIIVPIPPREALNIAWKEENGLKIDGPIDINK
jgi:hypothetical protein